MDKNSGGVCLALSSQTLAITGIDDRRYWTYIPTEESRCISWLPDLFFFFFMIHVFFFFALCI